MLKYSDFFIMLKCDIKSGITWINRHLADNLSVSPLQHMINYRRCVSAPADEDSDSSQSVFVYSGVCRQECFSHAHAVVYHAASTVPSAPDHAPSLSPSGRRITHLCVRLVEALSHAPRFPHRVWNDEWSEAEDKPGELTYSVSGVHARRLLGS